MINLKFLILIFFVSLSGCSTTEKTTKEDSLVIHRELSKLNVDFIDRVDYLIHIVPKEYSFEGDNLSLKGKAIINNIKKLYSDIPTEQIFVVGHSSSLSKNPLKESKHIAKVASQYLSELYGKNIVSFAKGDTDSVYQKKSYNHYKLNDRFEIMIIKKNKI